MFSDQAFSTELIQNNTLFTQFSNHQVTLNKSSSHFQPEFTLRIHPTQVKFTTIVKLHNLSHDPIK